MNTKKGYLYAATGKKFTDEAAASVRSLRLCQSDVHVTLITDQECHYEEFDAIKILNFSEKEVDWKKGLLYKAQALQHSPYEITFFADTDTWFLEDCAELFDLTEHFDLLLAHSPADVSQVIWKEEKIKGLHPYNTGILVFKKSEKMSLFLADWLETYERKYTQYPSDQTPFMEALIRSQLSHYVLLPFYNFREHFLVSLPPGKVKIIHGRPKNPEKLARIINADLRHRAWLPRRYKVVFRRPKSWKNRLKQILRKFISK